MIKNSLFIFITVWFAFIITTSLVFKDYDVIKSLSVFSSYCLYLITVKKVFLDD